MRVLQIGADRSKRGILYPGSAGFARQEAYAKRLGNLDIIAFSRRSDGARPVDAGALRIYPTDSPSRAFYLKGAMRRALALPKPDIVSAQDPFETGLVAWLIARMKGAPLHVQVHTDFLSPEYARTSLTNKVRILIAGFVVRKAARIRVVSERIKRSLEERYQVTVPITVLPIFVDRERLRGPSDPTIATRFRAFKTRVLVVSRLEPEKNVQLAIEAFAASAPADACLVIVGGGSQRGKLERLARDRAVTERIFFEGERDAAPYYVLADLVLVPSSYEGYGLTIVEALSAGVPVLSTDVGAAREAGALIAPRSGYAQALRDWFDRGPREGHLANYPYADFDQYVRAYCDDMAACAKTP